jgi:hypothetical protein
MAHVFYPSGSVTYIRNVSGSNLYEFHVASGDNIIFYLTGSNYNTSSLTASYAISASYALNGGSAGGGLATGSTYPITASWAISSSLARTASIASIGDIFVGTRTLPSAGDAVNIGTLSQNNGAMNIMVALTVSDGNISIAKSYFVVANYSQAGTYAGANYRIVAPASTTANYQLQGIELEAQQTDEFLSLGIRKTSGVVGGNVFIRIVNLCHTGLITFTPSTTTRASTDPGYWPSNTFEQDPVLVKCISHVGFIVSGSLVVTSSITSSQILGTSSFARSSSYAVSASYAQNGGSGGSLTTGSTYPITASWALDAISSSYSLSSSRAQSTISSSYALSSSYSIFAETASLSVTQSHVVIFELSSSFASSSISASYAFTASHALNGGGGGTGTSSFYEFPVYSARLPSLSSSRIDGGNLNWALYFDRNENAYWQWRVPDNYDGALKNIFQFYMTGSQTGSTNLAMNIYLYTVTPGDLTSVSQSVVTLRVPLTASVLNMGAGYLAEQFVWLTGSVDPVAPGDFMIYRLERTTGSIDTASGSMALVTNMITYDVR